MQTDLSDDVTGSVRLRLYDEDGHLVKRHQTTNQLVDAGRNALLRLLTDQPTQATRTFTGDGSQQVFNLPTRDLPVHSVNSVQDGGTTLTWGSDYAVRYETGEIYFASAPANGNTVTVDVNLSLHPTVYLGVGTDNTAVQDADTALGAEVARVGPDSNYWQHDPATVTVTGRWTLATGQANVSIAEAGLFSAPNPGTGTLLNRTIISPAVSKNNSQTLEIDWSLTMS